MPATAFQLPDETDAERGAWLPCAPSELLVGDRVRRRELAQTGGVKDGVTIVGKETKVHGPRGWRYTVNSRTLKVTTATVQRVTERYAFCVIDEVDGVSPTARKPLRLARAPNPNHLADLARDPASGPSDRDVDPLAHSHAENCARFVATVAGSGIDASLLQDAVFEAPEADRFGEPEPTSEEVEAIFAGRAEARPWIWRIVDLAIADPDRFMRNWG